MSFHTPVLGGKNWLNRKTGRRKWTTEKKIEILRSHFAKAKLIDTCEEFRVHPNLLASCWKAALEEALPSFSGEGLRKKRRMESFDVEVVLRRAREDCLSNETRQPRLITDNRSQYLSRDFKCYLREVGMKHSRSAPNHPQSKGKIERFHGTVKSEYLRKTPKITLAQMKAEPGRWIEYYNKERLHSSLEYVSPFDVIFGRRSEITKICEEKLLLGKSKRAKQNGA